MQEKEERIRAEHEAKRDAVEFALRYEGRFLKKECKQRTEAVESLVARVGRLHRDRRTLACRLLRKYRPFEAQEYFLWIWEVWQVVRRQLQLEKLFEQEQVEHESVGQMLIHTSSQIPHLSRQIDVLRRDLALERTEHSLSKKEIMATSGKQMATLSEFLTLHRQQELKILHKLHVIECEEKDEKIAILEREICEDKHVVSLRNMVIDLETRLRKALDMRKQKPYLVPPGPRTNREMLMRGWKVDAQQRAGSADASLDGSGITKSVSAAALLDLQSESRVGERPPDWHGSAEGQRRPFLAVWR
jgi:hypothetical protein